MHQFDFQDTPIIISVKNNQALKKSLQSNIPIVFLMYGDIVTLPGVIAQLKEHHKTVLVHLEFIEGLSNHEVVLTYIKKVCHADGIITTKRSLIEPAKRLGLITILRFFVIDHLSIDNIVAQLRTVRPDMVEVLPALIPMVISSLKELINVPIVTGGMVTSKKDVIQALNAGALCVSASSEEVWSLLAD